MRWDINHHNRGKPTRPRGQPPATTWWTHGRAHRPPDVCQNHTENRLLADHTRTRYRHRVPTRTSTLTPAAARQSQRQTSQPYGGWHHQAPTTLLQKQHPDRKQTTRKPATTETAGHARVKRGTASPGLATPCCATPADDHTHEDNNTPQLYHYTTDQPMTTTYYGPPGPPAERKLDRVKRRE